MILRFTGVLVIVLGCLALAAGRITWQGAGICVAGGLALCVLGRSRR